MGLNALPLLEPFGAGLLFGYLTTVHGLGVSGFLVRLQALLQG